MKFKDYTPPEKPSVVIDGKLVEFNSESASRLAENAMELAGEPRPGAVPTDGDPQVREVAEAICAALASREAGYSVEAWTSVVHTRVYISAAKESTGELYFIQLDTAKSTSL